MSRLRDLTALSPRSEPLLRLYALSPVFRSRLGVAFDARLECGPGPCRTASETLSPACYHLCWGSWHGPHSHDLPLKDIVGTLLSVNAQAYLFEAANVRHEHEYVVWKPVKLPENKILAPGVVSHATTLIEHPELVAERIQRFARIVGRDRVVASTDRGLGLRCHPKSPGPSSEHFLAALSSRAKRYGFDNGTELD